jgi:hypothetical protein
MPRQISHDEEYEDYRDEYADKSLGNGGGCRIWE